MTAPRDFDRLIEAYLDDGRDELPEHAYAAVRTRIEHTRQRVVIGPWKEEQMFRYATFAIAAAAIVLVAVVGIRLLPAGGGIGGQPPTYPPPTPTPRPLTVTSSGPVPIEAGTYVAGAPFLVPLTFTVPEGWNGNIGGPYAVLLEPAQGGGDVWFSIFSKVYADPCHNDRGLMSPLPGPSAADLVTALTNMPSVTASAISDGSIGGYSAKQMTLTAPDSFAGCTLTPDGNFRVWELPLGATNDMTPGEVQRLWILDVDGQRLVIAASGGSSQSTALNATIQGILDSISIVPHN